MQKGSSDLIRLTALLSLPWLFSCLCVEAQTKHATVSTTAKRDLGPVAKVLDLKGKVYRFNGFNKVYLKKGEDIFPDTKLNSEAGGWLVLHYQNEIKDKEIIRQRRYPYIVPHMVKDTGVLSSLRIAAGRPRGDGDRKPIYSPPQAENGSIGCVWPAECVFRWTPFPNGTALTLTLRSTSTTREMVWSKSMQDNGNGMGIFADARMAMSIFRKAHPNADLEFTLVSNDGTSHSVRFSLIAEKEDLAVKDALAKIERRRKAMEAEDHKRRPMNEWEDAKQENALISHISRASLFQHHYLYTEAAEEMEKAFKVAPDRGDIWRGAIWAHRRTGNAVREQCLRTHPPPGEVETGDI